MPVTMKVGWSGPEVSGIELGQDTLARVAEWIVALGEDFTVKIGIVHRKTVFQILTRILRLCPVDTGRLRGSFTPFMDKYAFTGYAKYQSSASLSPKHRKTPGRGYSDEAFNEGKALGEIVDAYLDTTIGTNVVYAPFVDNRTNFLLQALIWGDMKYAANMEAFLLATAQKEAAQDLIAPDDDGQGGA